MCMYVFACIMPLFLFCLPIREPLMLQSPQQVERETAATAAFVDIASKSELQKTLRSIKNAAEKRLFVLMTKPIFDNVNRTFARGGIIDTSDRAIAAVVTVMAETLPDIFVKWLRSTRLLEAEEAQILAQNDIDVDPIVSALPRCDSQDPTKLFVRFVHDIYIRIILGQDLPSQGLQVSENEVSRRMTEVLETIAPTSKYFCREPASVPIADAEKLYVSAKDEVSTDRPDDTSSPAQQPADYASTGGESDSDSSSSSDQKQKQPADDYAPTYTESESGSGSDASASGSESESGSGSDSEEEESRHKYMGVDEQRRPVPKGIVNMQKENMLNKQSDFVKKPNPSEIRSDHIETIKEGWEGATDTLKSAVSGVKMVFGGEGDDGDDKKKKRRNDGGGGGGSDSDDD